MLTTMLRTAILMAAMLAGCPQAGTPGDIHALGAGEAGQSAPVMGSLNLPENGAAAAADRNVQNTSPVWYSLSDNRKVKAQDWKVVLFTRSTCPYCRQFASVLKALSQKTGFDISPISLDGRGDAEFPDVLPTMPDVMVKCFQSGLLVAMPTVSLTNVNTVGTWPLLQGAAEAGEFCSRLNEVLYMILDRQSEESIPLSAQG